MASQWTVTVWDRRAGGRGEQDLTLRFDVAASHLVGTAGDRVTTSDYVFVLNPTDDYIIDSFCEVHAGYRDPITHVWDETHPFYGGFITEHTGHFEADRHIFDCTVSSHNILFDRTEVLTWPTDILLGDTPLGYPEGQSVRDWLIGTTAEGLAYKGIIPFHFQHVSNGGVDPVFDAIILGVDGDYMPAQGDSELFGHYGFMSVRALLDEMVKVARAAALAQDPPLDVRPVYFWRLIAVDTTLIPQFCFMDLNAQTITADVKYGGGTSTEAGTLPIEYPYRHTRNAQPVRTRVTVKGEGADGSGLIYYSYLVAAGSALYPTYYQIRDGWAGAPINESTINVREQATRFATLIGDAIWGPEGQITFNTRVLQGYGRRVALYFPEDGQIGQIYPVLDHSVNLNPGSPIDSLVLGQRTRDMADFLVPRPDAPMPMTDAGASGGGNNNASAAGIGRSGAQVPSGVKTRPVVGLPVHDDQNVVRPRTTSVIGQTWDTTQNGPAAAFDTPPPVKALMRTRDNGKNVRDWWSGVDGTNHPQHYDMHITAAQTVLLVLVDPCQLVTDLILNKDGTVNTGVTVAYKLNDVTATLPITGARFDVLTLTFAGTFPTGGIAFLVTEAPETLVPAP